MGMKINAKFIVSLLAPLTAGFVGSFFTAPFIESWYSTLDKPLLSPPNWVFAPVWTTLYILMGISLYLIWSSKKNNKSALDIFIVQLVLNSLWSIVFFGRQDPVGGFIVIVVLWFTIAKTIYEFNKINTKAAYLLVPYLLWVSFASYLNLMIVLLN